MARTTRWHAIDWLRALAVFGVFWAHVAHVFDFDVTGSMRNDETSFWASLYMFFTNQWLMELIFLLAGVSSWLSLRSRTAATYLRERIDRLLIPLVFGTLVLIPWNGYVSALNRATYDGSFWRFVPVHFERTWEALMLPHVYHGLVILYYTSWHLWFLGYLLIFSVIAVFLPKRPAAAGRLALLCERRTGMLALAAPIVVIKLALDAPFPSHADWSDTLVFLTMFVYGWLFMTDARFLRAVERQFLTWLMVGCVTFAVILATYAAGYLLRWLDQPAYTADYLAYQALVGLNTWAWTLALIGGGLRWLNFDHAILRYANEATLPFYMLHQVVVLTVAMIAVQWSTSVTVKILVIGAVALAITMLVYEFAIRRSSTLRVLFGLRPVRSAS